MTNALDGDAAAIITRPARASGLRAFIFVLEFFLGAGWSSGEEVRHRNEEDDEQHGHQD
jgi:hypothetical protein